MGMMSKLIRQCRKPTGWLGKATAWGMNKGHSEITEWGLGYISIGKSDKILDVGCGGGETVHRMAKIAEDGRVYGVDFSRESIAVSRGRNRRLIRAGRVAICCGCVSDLPFADDLFDLVTAIETHYFWPDLVSDMQVVLRVLKPGGRLIIIGEAYKGGKYEDRNQKWVQWGDMIYHSVDELGEFFAAAGFSDVQVVEEYDKGWVCGVGQKPF